MRFAMMEVAALLDSSCQAQPLSFQLLKTVEEVCADPDINFTKGGVIVGPAMYLVKLLVRQYGFSFLKRISKEYPWIVPDTLRKTEVS